MASLTLTNVSVDFPIYGTRRSLRRTLFARATGGLITGGKDRSSVRGGQGADKHLVGLARWRPVRADWP